MIIESKQHLLSLRGEEYRNALIALHHADDTTLERLNITSADVSLWLDEEGIIPPESSVVGESSLEQIKSQALTTIREMARQHIEEPPSDATKWPNFRQINVESGIYADTALKDQKDKDIAATIEESNRVEVAIEDSTTEQEVQDALDSANFPTFPVA